jgi:hypothetical protein
MSHDDFAFEKIRGLPADLPRGEQLLWQGAPTFKSLAIHTYYVRLVALYFGALVLWRIGVGIGAGNSVGAVALSCVWLAGLGSVAAGVLTLLAYLSSRTTVYSITSARVILRHGIAVPVTVNIPFTLLEAANLAVRKNGNGDIAFKLRKDQRLGYLVTWPHLRPGYITHPQPSFRSLPEAQAAASLLGEAVARFAGGSAVRAATPPGGVPIAIRPRTAAAA